MSDLFGFNQPRAEFVDIRDQRPSTAEQKAILCKQLTELLRTPPGCLASFGIKDTRAWVAQYAKAKKILSNTRSSVNELTVAISQMSSYNTQGATQEAGKEAGGAIAAD